MIKRIKLIMKEEGMSELQFSKRINVPHSSVSGYLSEKVAPSAKFITSIIDEFSAISTEWLLRGEGNMYKTTELPTVDVSSEESINHSAEIARLVREKNEMADIIDAQAKEIARLQAQLDWASSIIKDSLREEPAQKVG